MSSRRYADRLIQTLMDYVGDLDAQPREIVLEETAFLHTAFECRIVDYSAKPRRVIEPFMYGQWELANAEDQTPDVKFREVRVGDSFIIQGPAGPCTVRCWKKR